MKTESISFAIFYLGVLSGICLVVGALLAMIIPHPAQDIGWDYTQICIGAAMGIFASWQFIYFLHREKVNKNKSAA